MEREQIVDAVVEVNKVLGLEPEIDTGLSTDQLKAKLKEADELIGPEDEFSEGTKAILESVRQPKAEANGAGRPVSKRKGVPTGRPVPKREGSMSEFIDNLALAGATWEEMKTKAAEEGEKRGTTNFNTIAKIKAHLKFRGASKKYNVVMDDTNVKMTQVG